MKNDRPLSALAPWRSASASSSSVTITPGIRPALNARAAPGESRNTFASARTGRFCASDVAQQLVVLARVVADLVDHEARAGPDLLGELLVLRDDLALVQLVIGDHAPEEEVRPVEPLVGPRDVQAGVHVAVELQQADRVDVEHRRGGAAVPAERVVARQAQDVAEPLGGELPAPALERVAVPVLAGQVDDHLLPARDQVGAERVGREHRVATGVVGDRQHVDPGIIGQRARLVDQRAAAIGGDHPTGGHQLDRDRKRAGRLQAIAKRRRRQLTRPFSALLALQNGKASVGPRGTHCNGCFR